MKMQSLLLLAPLFFFISCGNRIPSALEEDDHGAWKSKAVPTQTDIQLLRKDLESYLNVVSNETRPERFFPEKVLPRIHPWLSIGAGLKTTQIGNIKAYRLKAIPPEVLSQLNSHLYPESLPVPLMVLRRNFWTRLAALQGNGHSVGFMAYVPGANNVGLYIQATQIFLFDTFAEYATLSHEMRHKTQFDELIKTHSRTGDSSPITDECARNFGNFLGEIDSTTIELPEWKGVFSTLDYKPAEYQTISEITEVPAKSFYWELLSGNLEYPAYAAKKFQRGICPKEVDAAVDEISNQTCQFEIDAKRTFGSIQDIRIRFAYYWIDKKGICKHPATNEERKICDDHERFMLQIDSLAERAIQEMNEIMESGYQERSQFVAKTLSALPREYRGILCRNVRAFSLLNECP